MNPDLERLIADPSLLKHATRAEIDYIENALTAELALRSPADYEKFDDPDFDIAPHIRLISDTIVSLVEGKLLNKKGKPYRKLMVKMPPRHGKSRTATLATGAWLLTKYPERNVMSLSYNADVAADFGREIRNRIERNAETFGITTDPTSRSVVKFKLANHKGGLMAVGIHGSITSRPGDIILIDDPVKEAEDVMSEVGRQNVWDTYSSAIFSRQTPNTIQILTYTHWHEDDLGGRLKLNEPGEWYELVLPALALENDPLGRKLDTALWPNGPHKMDTAWMKHLRTTAVPWVWSALYQQHPAIEGAGIFHKEHVRYASYIDGGRYIRLHKPTETPNYTDYPIDQCWYFGTADLATAQKNYSDYTAIGTYLVTPDFNLVQVGQFHRRIDSSEHEETIDRIIAAHNLRFMSVENKVYGITLIQTMIRKGKRVRKSQADTDKVTRAITAATYMQAGRIYFLQGEKWLDELIPELLIFDKGAHDDQVDCLAYAARILAEHEKHPYTFSKEAEPKTYDERFWREIDKRTKPKRRRRLPDW